MPEHTTFNMKHLRTKDEDLANRLCRINHSAEFEICETPSLYPTIRHSLCDGRYRFIHSRVNPKKEAETWAYHQQPDRNGAVLFGLGLAYHASEFLQAYPECRTVLVVEATDSLFRAAIDSRNLSDILANKRIYLHVGGNPNTFQEIVTAVLNLSFSYHVFLPAIASRPDVYATMLRIVQKQLFKIRRQRDENNENHDRHRLSFGVEKLLTEMNG